MAREYNRFKLDDGLIVTVSDDNTEIKTEINGETFEADINKATRAETNYFMAGVGYGRVLSSNLVKAEKQDDNNNIIDMQNAFGNPNSQEGNGMGNSNQMTHGYQKTLVPPGGRSPYQPQSYQQFPNDNQFPGNMAAFSDRLLIAILGSFALGVIAATVYIFINLGKVTITL